MASPSKSPSPPPIQILASAKEAADKSGLPADQVTVDELSGGTGDFFKVRLSLAEGVLAA